MTCTGLQCPVLQWPVPDLIPANNNADRVAATDPERLVIAALRDSATERLLYTLSGPDAMYFGIYRATGQIITQAILDYESLPANKKHFNVQVTATDKAGLSDTTDVTINVVDVNEPPVPVDPPERIRGSPIGTTPRTAPAPWVPTRPTSTNAENARWSVGGADGSLFMVAPTSGMSTMLSFRSSPNFEAPTDAGGDNVYMVTIQVSEGADDTATRDVAIMVTNVEELGALAGSDTANINEGDTDLGTYTLTGGTMDATATWGVGGTDMSDFMLDGTGMSSMLKFSSAPDYESPMGGADNDSNTYMVTVMASAGGEMEMLEVTVTVDNAEEGGTVTLNPTRPSVGTEITATVEDMDIVSTESLGSGPAPPPWMEPSPT